MPGLGTAINKGINIGSGYADQIAPKLRRFGDTNEIHTTGVGRNGSGIRRI
jgi:hypothetical protein